MVSLVIYLLTWSALGAIGANALALSATFVANTWANARFTIGTRRPDWRIAGSIYLGSLLFTSVALLVVGLSGGGFGLQLAVLIVTWMAVAGCRFALTRATPSSPGLAA